MPTSSRPSSQCGPNRHQTMRNTQKWRLMNKWASFRCMLPIFFWSSQKIPFTYFLSEGRSETCAARNNAKSLLKKFAEDTRWYFYSLICRSIWDVTTFHIMIIHLILLWLILTDLLAETVFNAAKWIRSQPRDFLGNRVQAAPAKWCSFRLHVIAW